MTIYSIIIHSWSENESSESKAFRLILSQNSDLSAF